MRGVRRVAGSVLAASMLVGCAAAAAPGQQAGSPVAGSSAEVCVGLDDEWAGIPEPVRSYGLAWNERDATLRQQHLETAFAVDGRFVDPWQASPIVGRPAFDRRIADFHLGREGQYFEFRDWSDAYILHDRAMIPWRLCDADGTVLMIGADFGIIDGHGRLVDVTSLEFVS